MFRARSALCMLLLGLRSSTVWLPPHQPLPCARRVRRLRRTTFIGTILIGTILIGTIRIGTNLIGSR